MERAPGHRIADDGQRHPAVGRRAFRTVGDHRVAVHRRAIEARHVDAADDGTGEHAARGNAERDVFGGQRVQLRIQPVERGLNGVALRETAHPHVVGCCSIIRRAHAGRTHVHVTSRGHLSQHADA